MNDAAALLGSRIGHLAPSASSRIWLAVAAALLMHAAAFTSTRPSARFADIQASAPVRAITVRAIPSAVPLLAAPPTAGQEGGGTMVPPQPDVASPSAPKVTTTRTAEPQPAAMPTAATAEPTASAAAAAGSLPVATATPALASKAEAAERFVALPAAPDYLLGATLDPGPQPIGDIEPEYPASANLQEGKVVIRVLISASGQVDNVAVVRAAPPGLFEAATLEAFGKAQFTPARAAGVPVKSQITVEVHFLPINRGSRISGRSY